MPDALTIPSWDKDDQCINTISDILSMLPKLKASGVVSSYVVTDSKIRIELSTGSNPQKRWWGKKE